MGLLYAPACWQHGRRRRPSTTTQRAGLCSGRVTTPLCLVSCYGPARGQHVGGPRPPGVVVWRSGAQGGRGRGLGQGRDAKCGAMATPPPLTAPCNTKGLPALGPLPIPGSRAHLASTARPGHRPEGSPGQSSGRPLLCAAPLSLGDRSCWEALSARNSSRRRAASCGMQGRAGWGREGVGREVQRAAGRTGRHGWHLRRPQAATRAQHSTPSRQRPTPTPGTHLVPPVLNSRLDGHHQREGAVAGHLPVNLVAQPGKGLGEHQQERERGSERRHGRRQQLGALGPCLVVLGGA